MKVQQGSRSSATESSPTPIDGVFSNLSPPSSGTATPKTLADDDGFSLVECYPDPIPDTEARACPQHHDEIKEAIERAQFVGGNSPYGDGNHGDPSPPYGGNEEDEEAELRALQLEMAYDGPPQPPPLKKGWTQHPPKSLVPKEEQYGTCGTSDINDEYGQEREQFQENFRDRTGDYRRLVTQQFSPDDLNLGLRGTKEVEEGIRPPSHTGEPSPSSGNWGGNAPQGEYRCSLLPSRKAAWVHKSSKVKLSTLAAMVLFKENMIQVQDLEVYHLEEAGPTDPISGIIGAAHSTVGGVVMGVADYPIEITKMVKADREVAPSLAKDFALDSGKGISRIVGTGLKAPMQFTMGISKGFNNVPKLYQDDTVREPEKVTGIVSGLSAAGKGFGYGLFDGVTGLVTQPVKGAQNGGGFGGFMKGFGKGIGGVVCKPAAGAVGLPAYAFKGVYEQVRKIGKPDAEQEEIAALLAQGEAEWDTSTYDERKAILGMWLRAQRDNPNSTIDIAGKRAKKID